MQRPRTDPRGRDLVHDPRAQVRIRTVLVSGQLGKNGAKNPNSVDAICSLKTALDQLLLNLMWHRHRGRSSSIVCGRGLASSRREECRVAAGAPSIPLLPSAREAGSSRLSVLSEHLEAPPDLGSKR